MGLSKNIINLHLVRCKFKFNLHSSQFEKSLNNTIYFETVKASIYFFLLFLAFIIYIMLFISLSKSRNIFEAFLLWLRSLLSLQNDKRLTTDKMWSEIQLNKRGSEMELVLLQMLMYSRFSVKREEWRSFSIKLQEAYLADF